MLAGVSVISVPLNQPKSIFFDAKIQRNICKQMLIDFVPKFSRKKFVESWGTCGRCPENEIVRKVSIDIVGRADVTIFGRSGFDFIRCVGVDIIASAGGETIRGIRVGILDLDAKSSGSRV